MKTIRLILGDQLNAAHTWFSKIDDDVIYLMAEMKQEAQYVTHHIQKLLAFFAAMRRFSKHLQALGHRVHYLHISDPNNPHNLEVIVKETIETYRADRFEYLLPDEYRLDRQLIEITGGLEIETGFTDTEHFYTERDELHTFFKGKKQLLMESFYRMMRKKHEILLTPNGAPEGGKWNYDKSNRKTWGGDPALMPRPDFKHDVQELKKEIEDCGIKSIGNFHAEQFNWPLDRNQALEQLEHFINKVLPYFGDYQDAMHTQSSFLFHSCLSFPLNAKIISPKEVVNKVLEAYYEAPESIHISQAEGFIRQIVGWREYMRGIYWREMPDYGKKNFFENKNALPDFFWTGNTKMNCLKHCIDGSLKNAYAHHIQRLMVTGNFALLNQTDPDAVDSWYLGIYIDAVEWVELTNTRGMSQYADGGLLATKPYISSANYINKMSNYCTSCSYDPKKRIGKDACPFNALYWNFLDDKRELLKNNRRMGMMYHLLDKIDREELAEMKERSKQIMETPDQF